MQIIPTIFFELKIRRLKSEQSNLILRLATKKTDAYIKKEQPLKKLNEFYLCVLRGFNR